jgi:N-acetyl sugar amidotransferase
MSKPAQVCVRCIMDTTDPDISFDAKGICNHCTSFLAQAEAERNQNENRERRLAQIIDEMKAAGKEKDYDCVIGVSGGVDSTFVAYKVKQFGLRPLAVHLDNGWDSELAVSNIQKTLEVLCIDLHTHVLDWEEFRDLQLSFLKASTPDSEVPTDHAIEAVLMKTAVAHGVQYVIGGSNFATEAIMPLAWSRGMRDWKYIKSVHKMYGSVPLRTFPHFRWLDALKYGFVNRIKVVHLLNHIPYVKSEALEVLQKQLGWIYYGGKHYESIYTRFFQAYILPKKFNFDKRKGHLSTLICSGEISRERALELMQEEVCPEDLMQLDKQFVIKKLGISEEDFENIMTSAPRQFWDYPSYEKSPLFRAVRKFYRARQRLAQA